KDIVADDALSPLHPVLAGHPELPALREVHEADPATHRLVLGGRVSVMRRHLPAGLLDERRPALHVFFVKARALHVFPVVVGGGPAKGAPPTPTPTTSWTSWRVLDENSFRETILVTPRCWARFQLSTSSWLAKARTGIDFDRASLLRASSALNASSPSSLMLRTTAAGRSAPALDRKSV